MNAHLIIAALPDAAALDILQRLHETDRPAHRACINLLAGRRKLRPVLLDRKSIPERNAWLRSELSRRSNDDTATEILQSWLLGAHGPMICQFLDLLHIPHDGKGLVETLPAQPDPAALQTAVATLLDNHPIPAVAAYLNLFVEMDIADWPALENIVAEDSRLCLAPQPSAA